METGCGVSPYIWESLIILWPNYGVLERRWLEHGPRVITELVFKLILFWRTNGWLLIQFILWNSLTWFWIAGGSSTGTRRRSLSIYGERPIAVWIYWRKEVLPNPKRKFCMIPAPLFCGNVYIGTPWVLSHLGIIADNKSPVIFCLVSARPLFGVSLIVLCVGMCFLVK